MEEKPTSEAILELHKTLQSIELFPGDKTNWTVELMNEEDLEGPIVFKDEKGSAKMWMSQEVYAQFKRLPQTPELLTEWVLLHFKHTDDKELTCFICGRFECDQEAVVYTTTRQGTKSRTAFGKHTGCKIEQVRV